MPFIMAFIVFMVVVALPGASRAEVRFADIGFQVSAGLGSISPVDFNELLARYDADAVTSAYGFGASVVLPVGERFRASFGSGYLHSNGGKGTIVLLAAPNPTGVPTPIDFEAESVPVVGGVDFLLADGSPTLTIGAAFEMHYLKVTRRIHEQQLLGFPGDTDSETASIPGFSLAVGVEWAVNRSASLGGGLGYRFAEGDVPFFGIPGADYPFDLGGAFVRLLVRIHPWSRSEGE